MAEVPVYLTGSIWDPPGAAAPATTVQSADLINLDGFRADPRFSDVVGTGFTSVVIDTGIDLDHPFFGPDSDGNGVADRIVYDFDFFGPGFVHDSNASDGDGHGSNVASIIASSDATYTGVAPDANIIALKVFSDVGGPGNFTDVEEALRWTVQNARQYNIASVNLSLGDDGNYMSNQSLYGLSDELAALADLEVIVVAAAGNSFYDHDSQQGVSYPAADANVLAVSAVYTHGFGSVTYSDGARADRTGSDLITPFTQRHETQTDIFAPGAPITGANAFGGTVTMHGTSQASPHVAGAAVLMQQLASERLGRRLTPQEFTSLMRSSADTIRDGDDERDNVINTGLTFLRLDLLAMADAVYALGTGNPGPEPDPDPSPQPTPGLIDQVAGLIFNRDHDAGARSSFPLRRSATPIALEAHRTVLFEMPAQRDGGADLLEDASQGRKNRVLLALADTEPQPLLS